MRKIIRSPAEFIGVIEAIGYQSPLERVDADRRLKRFMIANGLADVFNFIRRIRIGSKRFPGIFRTFNGVTLHFPLDIMKEPRTLHNDDALLCISIRIPAAAAFNHHQYPCVNSYLDGMVKSMPEIVFQVLGDKSIQASQDRVCTKETSRYIHQRRKVFVKSSLRKP